MKIEITYHESELFKGKCKSCGDKTKVYISDLGESKFDGMCPDCIEAIKFEEMTNSTLSSGEGK